MYAALNFILAAIYAVPCVLASPAADGGNLVKKGDYSPPEYSTPYYSPSCHPSTIYYTNTYTETETATYTETYTDTYTYTDTVTSCYTPYNTSPSYPSPTKY